MQSLNTQIRSSSGISLVPLKDSLFHERKLFLEGTVDDAMAVEFARDMHWLLHEDRDEPVQVFINSDGGSIEAGLLMLDVIRSCSVPVQTVCLGKAYSMAAVLFAAGTRRSMLPNSRLMLHEPRLGSDVSGTASEMEYLAKTMGETRKQMNEILAALTGKSIEEMETACSYDHYFKAQEALDFGLCDEIAAFADLV